jgi:hypothetical protein
MRVPDIDVVSCDRLPDDEFYVVSGDRIVAWRNGEAIKLEGAEKERVRRWLIRDAEAKPGKETP